MSNILLKHLLLKTVGNVGFTALGAAAQARQENAVATARATNVTAKRRRKDNCTPCAGRALVYQVQKKYLG